MSKKAYCLRRIDLYEGISHEEFTQVADKAIESYINADEMIYEAGQTDAMIYILKEGEIELYKIENGKKIVLETLFSGDVFGDFGMGKYNHNAQVTRKAYICQTPITEFLKLIKEYPRMVFQIMKIMAKRTQEYENKIALLSSPAKEQLFYQIKYLYKKNSKRFLQKIINIPFKISHQKLSEKTGLNRVTVTRLIKELVDEKKIYIDEKSRAITLI